MPDSYDMQSSQEATRRENRAIDFANKCRQIDNGHIYGDVELEGIKVKVAGSTQIENMVILTGVNGEGLPVVAFHSVIDLERAITSAISRYVSGQLKWKEDEYRTGKKG